MVANAFINLKQIKNDTTDFIPGSIKGLTGWLDENRILSEKIGARPETSGTIEIQSFANQWLRLLPGYAP
jgi:hypothetical protein